MAVLFMDSFDHYSTATGTHKHFVGPTITPAGKHGKGMTGAFSRPLATVRHRRVIMGCWFRGSLSMGPTMVGSASGISGLSTRADGSFSYGILDSALTSYTSDPDLWRPDKWHWIVLDVLLDTGTAGHLKVYLDDPDHSSPIINLTGIYTVSSGFAVAPYYWGGVNVSAGGGAIDDLLVLDGESEDVYGNSDAPTDLFGPYRIDVVRPNGVGDKEEWTSSSGGSPADPNWQNVDDDVPDGATVNLAAPGDDGLEDLHQMQNISTGDTAFAQHYLIAARKINEGVGDLTMLAKHDGTVYELERRLLAEDFFYRHRVALHCMPGGDPLTDANFNAQQMGYRRGDAP